MKPSQQVTIEILLPPEIACMRAVKAAAALSDEEAVSRADWIQSVLSPVMGYVQEQFLAGAREEHDVSEEKRLVVRHGGKLVAAIQSAIDELSSDGPVRLTMLDKDFFALIPRILSASELLLYPCMEFSETLTAREIVAYGESLANAAKDFSPGDRPRMNADFVSALRRLARDDIFALRITTEEYMTQSRIFELLRNFCNAASARLTAMHVGDGALGALGLVQMLDRRSNSYRGCLSEADAAAFAEGLKNLVARLRRQSQCRTN